MNNTLKVAFYDEFRCTADKCPFTCCKGWEITVDTDTYRAWNKNEKQFGSLCKNVNIIKDGNEAESYINMGAQMCCPFLDEKGLCNVVIQHGEDHLPNTCKVFPRQENSFGDLKESSLSCACPPVVDIINAIPEKMLFSYKGDETIWDRLPLEYKIREAMLALLQHKNFSLKDRMLLIFHMLLFMKTEVDITKEMINKYQDESYLLSLVRLWSGTKIPQEASCGELNELFLDIAQNYRKETTFLNYFKDLTALAEDLEIERYHSDWNRFSLAFASYDTLIENCIVSKIFSNCISDDMDEMIMSFQILITEYVMVKYSTFLKWLPKQTKEIDYNEIRDSIVIYSRIIGYNTEGIIEFWEDSFEDAVWEFGYMLLLTN